MPVFQKELMVGFSVLRDRQENHILRNVGAAHVSGENAVFVQHVGSLSWDGCQSVYGYRL